MHLSKEMHEFFFGSNLDRRYTGNSILKSIDLHLAQKIHCLLIDNGFISLLLKPLLSSYPH